MRIITGVSLLLLATCVSAAAQQQEQGIYPGITYDSDILGNVNLTTGSLAVNHLVLKLPQWKGFAIGDLSLQYNSPVWVLEAPGCDPNQGPCDNEWMPASNSFVTAAGITPMFSSGVASWAFTTIPDADLNPSAQELQVTTPDGTVHDMVPTGSTYRSIDGSNLTVNSTATQLIDSSGTVYSIPTPQYPIVPPSNAYAGYTNSSSASSPMTITNTHGQSWTANNDAGGGAEPWIPSWSDTVGRHWITQETTNYSGCTGPVAIGDAWIYSIQDQHGTQHPVFKECLVAIPLVTNLGHCHNQDDYSCDYSDMGSQYPGWVQSIVFTPDGTWSSGNAWTFFYGETDFSSPDYTNYGCLTGIQTPQGGTVTYNLGSSIGSNGSYNCPVESKVVNAADGSGNQTTIYTYSTAGSPWATVTNPDSTSVTHQFDSGTSAEIGTIYKDQNGNTVKTVSNTYQAAGDPFNISESNYPEYANVFPTSQTTTWPNGISCMSSETYSGAYSYSVTFAQTGNPDPPTYSGTAPNGERATVSTYDCSSGGNPPLLETVQDSWMDSQNNNYYNKNLFGLLQQESVYDGSGNLSSQTTYGYDQNGEGMVGDQTSESEWINTGGSLQTSTHYDSNGQPILVIDPSAHTTAIGYDATDLVATSFTNPPVPSGVTLQGSSVPDPFSYLITSVTDANSQTTNQQYDAMFRPTTGTSANGASVSFTYQAAASGQMAVTTQTVSYDTTGDTASTQTVLDGFGRTVQSNQQTSNGSTAGWYQQDTCYDSMGRVSFQSYTYVTWSPTPAAHTCSGAGDTYSYDALGRLTSTLHQDGTHSTISYNARATESTDEMGVSRITQMDGLGRPTIVCELSSNPNMPSSGSPSSCGTDISGTGFVTSYSYSIANHSVTATQGGQQRVFQTDSLGRPIYSWEPESGVTTYGYAYNSTGLQVTQVRPQANQTSSSVTTTTTTQFDSIGRVISVSYLNGNTNLYQTPSKSFLYDALSSPMDSMPLGYSKGRLVSASTSATTTQLGGYDAWGNPGNTVQCLPDWCGQSAHDVLHWYQYDKSGLPILEQYDTQASSGTTISINTLRNTAGEVMYLSGGQNNSSTLQDPNGAPILFTMSQPGPFGPVSGKYGNNLGLAATYDTLGRINGSWVCTAAVMSPNCPGASQVYSYSVGWTGGYATSSSDSVLNRSSSYGYDEFGRMKTANFNSGQTVFSYQYDRWGNRWSQSASGSGSGSAPQPSFNFNTTNNQITSGPSCNTPSFSEYCYDAAGNMTADGFHTYTYDAEGNVVGVDGNTGVAGSAQYVYNASNHRVKTLSESGTVLRYAYSLDGQPESTWNSSGVLVTENYYADGQAVAYYSSTDANIHYQHEDWEGTVRMRTTYAGAVDGSYLSFPFGDGYTTSGNDTDPLHFALLDHDADSDTEHAEARQYSGTQGRWLSTDPYGGSYDAANPQSLNRYVYVLNNPMSMTDPIRLRPRGPRLPVTATMDPNGKVVSFRITIQNDLRQGRQALALAAVLME
jgi:RHS repeat-associated protein